MARPGARPHQRPEGGRGAWINQAAAAAPSVSVFGAGRRSRTLWICRGSASSTWNSAPELGCVMISLGAGTRPARVKISPPTVSMEGGTLLGCQHRPDPLLEILDREPGGDIQRAVRPLRHQRLCHVVVLVGDVADDRLHQILDGDKPVDAAIFVDERAPYGRAPGASVPEDRAPVPAERPSTGGAASSRARIPPAGRYKRRRP